MTITKYGHCCLLIEVKGVRLLTDPGSYATLPAKVSNVDAVFITHEHADHIHIETLKGVLKANPNVRVITNASVGKLLEKDGLAHEVVGSHVVVRGVTLDVFHSLHATIHAEWPVVDNTGIMIDGLLFFPGDAFLDPKRPVPILACPIAGPWCTMADGIEYAKRLRPRIAIPVHDGNLKSTAATDSIPKDILARHGIEFRALHDGERYHHEET